MKRSASVLVTVALVAVLFTSGAAITKNLESSINVSAEMENCLYLSESPSERVEIYSDTYHESINWNCGNLDYNGTTNLTLYDSGLNVVKNATNSANLSVRDNVMTNFSWNATETGTYLISASTQYFTTYENETKVELRRRGQIFEVFEPKEEENDTDTEDDDTTSSGGGSGGGGDSTTLEPTQETETGFIDLNLATPEDVVEVPTGDSKLVDLDVSNNGTISAVNLTIRTEDDRYVSSSEAYISELESNETLGRELALRVPKVTIPEDDRTRLIEATVSSEGEILESDSFAVEIIDSEERFGLEFLRYQERVELFREEQGYLNYTLRNTGEEEIGELLVRLQNEEDCAESYSQSHFNLKAGDSVSGGVLLQAKEDVRTCNVSVIASSANDIDVANSKISVKAKETSPLYALTDLENSFLYVIASAILGLSVAAIFEREFLKDVSGGIAFLPAAASSWFSKDETCEICGETSRTSYGMKLHKRKEHDIPDLKDLNPF